MIKYCKFKNCTYRCCQFHWVNRKFDNILLFDMTADSRCSKKKKTKLIVSEEQKVTQCHRKVICIETEIVYPSSKEAAEELRLSATLIRKCCRGEQASVGGFTWAYAE